MVYIEGAFLQKGFVSVSSGIQETLLTGDHFASLQGAQLNEMSQVQLPMLQAQSSHRDTNNSSHPYTCMLYAPSRAGLHFCFPWTCTGMQLALINGRL